MHLKMFFDKFKTVSTRLNLYFIWEIRKWSKYGNLLSFKTYWSTKSELKKQEKGGKEAGREAGREREREVEKMSKRINRKFKHSLQHGKYACLSFFTFKVDGPKIYFTKRCKKEKCWAFDTNAHIKVYFWNSFLLCILGSVYFEVKLPSRQPPKKAPEGRKKLRTTLTTPKETQRQKGCRKS